MFVPRDRPQRVERLGGRDTQAAPLAGREAPVAVVTAENLARRVHDRPLGSLHAAPLEERAVVVPAEEARLLALRPPRCREPGPRGLGPRLVLRLLPEREPDPVEPGRVELREHVRLVLVGVDGSRQQQPALVVHRPGVVPRRETAGAGASGKREQLVEPERAVAAGARIRRLAALVAADERIDDRAPELLAQVERHVRKTEAVARLAGRANGVGRAAGALGVRRLGIDPQPQGDSEGVAAGAQQRDGAVDAAAHGHRHPRIERGGTERWADRRRQGLDGELLPVHRRSLEHRQPREVLG